MKTTATSSMTHTTAISSNVLVIRNSVNASFCLQLDPDMADEAGVKSVINGAFQPGGLFHRLQQFLDANTSLRRSDKTCGSASTSCTSYTSYSRQHGSPCYLSDRASMSTLSAASSMSSLGVAEDGLQRCYSVEVIVDKGMENITQGV